jgi:hypothetical protein
VYFRDPVSGLFLTYPQKVVGELPLGADLTNIKRAVRYGELIDVNGTVFADENGQAQPQGKEAVVEQAATPAEEIKQKEETPAAEQDVVDVQESAAEEEVVEPVETGEDKKPVRKKRR